VTSTALTLLVLPALYLRLVTSPKAALAPRAERDAAAEPDFDLQPEG